MLNKIVLCILLPKNKKHKVMERKTKQVQAIIDFNKPLFHNQIRDLMLDAIKKCNNIFRERREALPFLRRIFAPQEIYHFSCELHMFYSWDGKAPMKSCKYILDPEAYPDAKYENRYLMSIFGLRDYRLYFNVIPGTAAEDQFGTMIAEHESVRIITIKANMKSNHKWERIQAEFLEMFVPIVKEINHEKNEATG